MSSAGVPIASCTWSPKAARGSQRRGWSSSFSPGAPTRCSWTHRTASWTCSAPCPVSAHAPGGSFGAWSTRRRRDPGGERWMRPIRRPSSPHGDRSRPPRSKGRSRASCPPLESSWDASWPIERASERNHRTALWPTPPSNGSMHSPLRLTTDPGASSAPRRSCSTRTARLWPPRSSTCTTCPPNAGVGRPRSPKRSRRWMFTFSRRPPPTALGHYGAPESAGQSAPSGRSRRTCVRRLMGRT